MSASASRRDFLKTASAAAAFSMSAASYARVPGANDRIRVAMIGCGDRGRGAHMVGMHRYDKEQNAEFVVVCDPWREAREKAAAMAKEWYGRDPKQCVSYREVMAMDDVDAVMIASCDHQHTTHLEAAARAKKDVYCEKPLGKNFESLKRACDAVRESGVVFQAGTQLRSFPSFTGCRDLYRTGVLGKVGRIEQHRNGPRPYWYAYLKDVKEADVDWKEFLMDAPNRPFDPNVYSGWYGYRDFSDGPVPGLASHYIDLIHYITGATFPTSCVCLGGTFTWIDDHKFTAPDHMEAQWIYPEGFMVTYSTNFGNGSGNTFKMFGNEAVMDMVEWEKPVLRREGGNAPTGKSAEPEPIAPVERPDHVLDWLQCIRSRQAPNANIDAGYQHATAVIMAMMSFDTGSRMVYDAEKREIRKG